MRTLFAGHLAQRKYGKRTVRSGHGLHDYETAGALLSELATSWREQDAYCTLLEIQTEQILARPEIWHQVEHLAAGLVEKQRMTGRDVKALLRDAFQEWHRQRRK